MLLFGAIVSGTWRAPKIVLGVAVLMVVRVLVSILFLPDFMGIGINLLMLVLIGGGAWDLRRQARKRAEVQA